MQKSRFSRDIVIALLGFLCVVASCDRSPSELTDAETIQHANQILSTAKLPVLPNGATNVRSWAGGAFAIYVNVKFSASPDQALDYFKRVGARYYFEFDSPEGRYRISATHFLTGPEDDIIKPSLFELEYRTGIPAQPWFKSVYEIRHGWYYSSKKDSIGFQLYYDLDTQGFYVYWHES